MVLHVRQSLRELAPTSPTRSFVGPSPIADSSAGRASSSGNPNPYALPRSSVGNKCSNAKPSTSDVDTSADATRCIDGARGRGSIVKMPRRKPVRRVVKRKHSRALRLDQQLVRWRWLFRLGRSCLNRTDARKLLCRGDGEGGATKSSSSAKGPNYPKTIAVGIGALLGLALSYDLLKFGKTLEWEGIRKWRKLTSKEYSNKNLAGYAGEPTIIYDIENRIVCTIATGSVPLSAVSDFVWQAVVASEDHRFFDHGGVDVVGISRALRSLGRGGGGSTITQQLVKNILLNQSRCISRKIVEMFMSVILERTLSKPQIIEAYLNNVYYGHGATGIIKASATYFRKKPKDLTLGEGAMLAGLLPAPEYLSPYHNPEKSLKSRNQVLDRMAITGFISEIECEHEQEKGLPNSLLEDGPSSSPYQTVNGAPYRAPYFVSEVLYFLKKQLGHDFLERQGGMKIYTAMNLYWQEAAEKLLFRDGKSGYLSNTEAAIVSMTPSDGSIRVLVGGRSYAKSQFNRAVLARRSPGSAFKPIVYLAALHSGRIGTSTMISDTPVSFPVRNQPNYEPQNFTRKFYGQVTVLTCFILSLNVPAVKIGHMVGVWSIIRMSRWLGLRCDLPPLLSLSLGACSVTPLELTTAYNTIANKGTYNKPYLVAKVLDCQGKLLYEHKPEPHTPPIQPEALADIHNMMKAVITWGTGRAAGYGWPSAGCAGKTGTSDDCRDAWFAGYTTDLTTTVWVGTDDFQVLPGTGGQLAAPVWAWFMRAIHGSGSPSAAAANKKQSPPPSGKPKEEKNEEEEDTRTPATSRTQTHEAIPIKGS